ncbi:SAV_6107 family HEPN domain-containing protein [Catellatospora sp. KI3]|uniref:SAV_6107 family HEPN domain-containing protein n=1 Tax=Catellatospora sp. KI3 TaxID=3041620 RepID=UPI002482BF5E|nr:SAV_6107 family HEPN domain-containing protein [Catellatospora sp. KI3]MDI1464892.1 SAV_6107 family HEPN domain-containing protein [Catellatospora sp. KI3]
MRATTTVPAHTLPHRTPIELMNLARRGLAEAHAPSDRAQQYAAAHLAALRAAAAVIAARATPAPARRKQITSVWILLSMVAPELTPWSTFFSAGAAKRSAAEAGIARVTAEEVDTIRQQAGRFIELIEQMLDLAA